MRGAWAATHWANGERARGTWPSQVPGAGRQGRATEKIQGTERCVTAHLAVWDAGIGTNTGHGALDRKWCPLEKGTFAPVS